MINKMTIAGLFLLVLIIAGCGTAPMPTPLPNNEGETARPTPTDVPDTGSDQAPAGYPPPPTAVPTREGYPVPEIPPTVDPYPASDSTAWVLHPVGIQCQDESDSKYPTEQDARSALTAAGITVEQMTLTELMVCQSCDCPTSAHYRAEISAADLDKALTLGWTAEQP